MQITGKLSEFSLAELFQFLEQGNKSGQLVIEPIAASPLRSNLVSQIWFKQGDIVAATHCADGNGLMSLLHKRGWMSSRAATRIMQVCALGQPLGLCLKSQGLLEAEQLQLVFRIQVLQQVCHLFQLTDGHFRFEHQVQPPLSEMTGLKAAPTEVTLAGLRALRDWSALATKLPDPNSGVINTSAGKPKYRLTQLEWQLWEFTQGSTSIASIAKQLNLPVEKIQQAAFRLIVTGFLEEVPFISEGETTALAEMTTDFFPPTVPPEAPVSQAFLQNLVGFLKGKI